MGDLDKCGESEEEDAVSVVAALFVVLRGRLCDPPIEAAETTDGDDATVPEEEEEEE